MPKPDTLDSNNHSTDGHKATGTFTFFTSHIHIRRHNDSTTESMIIKGDTHIRMHKKRYELLSADLPVILGYLVLR